MVTPSQARSGRRFELRGVVQGVGLRPWVYRLATSLGIDGRVRNDARGVTIEAFGTTAQLEEFEGRARREFPSAASVEDVRVLSIPVEPVHGFEIVPSPEPTDTLCISIPPDLAICPDCLAEILDPRDRRYRYPFTNCTHCGPRFTITREVPYDRPGTTMAAFRMCPACEREYTTPSDRRFHAQPNACPRCGPRLALLDEDGGPLRRSTRSPRRLPRSAKGSSSP